MEGVNKSCFPSAEKEVVNGVNSYYSSHSTDSRKSYVVTRATSIVGLYEMIKTWKDEGALTSNVVHIEVSSLLILSAPIASYYESQTQN